MTKTFKQQHKCHDSTKRFDLVIVISGLIGLFLGFSVVAVAYVLHKHHKKSKIAKKGKDG